MKISDFDVLSFDCYGTLIDWERGIYDALLPLLSRTIVDLSRSGLDPSRAGPSHADPGLSRAAQDHSREAVLRSFARLEAQQQEKTPEMTYPDLLAEVHGQLAVEWNVVSDPAENAAFGASIAQWPAFPDTVEALCYLKQHFKLVILSNVDRASFQATSQSLMVAFDAIYTAQDIGSYKPDQRNFCYLLDRLKEQGVPKEKVLHVAQSLFHDHVPANALGLASAWIDRRHDLSGSGATAPVAVEVHPNFRFISLAALVEAHRAR